MGWNSGAEIADELWTIVEKYIPAEERKNVAERFIDLMEGFDCDVMEETALWDVAERSRE